LPRRFWILAMYFFIYFSQWPEGHYEIIVIHILQMRKLVQWKLSHWSKVTQLRSCRAKIWTRQFTYKTEVWHALGQSSGSKPLHLATLHIHDIRPHFHSASAIRFYPGSVPIEKSQHFSRTQGRAIPSGTISASSGHSRWKCVAVLMNISQRHWLPVHEYFRSLCSFLSVVDLSLPSLLFDRFCLFLSLSFLPFSKIAFTI
jgi:hypothetical protein